MMSTIRYPNANADTTVKIFDNFYNYEQQVPTEQYDTIFGYFKSLTSDTPTAAAFTSSLFQVAENSQTDVMVLFKQIQGQDALQVNITLAYYLNGIRSKSALLGVSTPTKPNFYAARNVLS